MGKTIKLGGFGMSQGKCKPPDKRYRRKKKLLPGSLVVLFLGVLFIAVLAGMKVFRTDQYILYAPWGVVKGDRAGKLSVLPGG